jgi:hypothetical protein
MTVTYNWERALLKPNGEQLERPYSVTISFLFLFKFQSSLFSSFPSPFFNYFLISSFLLTLFMPSIFVLFFLSFLYTSLLFLCFMFCWPFISIHPCNKNQLDALFILCLLRQSTSTCFGHICSPSSGGVLYIYNNWCVLCLLVDCLLARLGQQTVD